MKVGSSEGHMSITDLHRHTRSPLIVPPRQPLALVYAPHQALSEPAHYPQHAGCRVAGLEPPLALDTAVARLDQGAAVAGFVT